MSGCANLHGLLQSGKSPIKLSVNSALRKDFISQYSVDKKSRGKIMKAISGGGFAFAFIDNLKKVACL